MQRLSTATMAPHPSVLQSKQQLRRDATARRDALSIHARQSAAEALAARAFPLAIARGVAVSGYMPIRSEISPLPLLRRLAREGARLALPIVAGSGKPLMMREWAWGKPLAGGVWGIREPQAEAAEVEPDILLVPLLAFDRAGDRLGYGAGYYDATLNRLRARTAVVAVGIAYAMQEVARVPTTKRDARLDLVLTEREVIDLRGG